MSRALSHPLVLGVALIAALAGCATEAPVQIVEVSQPAKVIQPTIRKWLRWQDSVATMNVEQLNTALEATPKPTTPNQLFYSGLLNQQSDNYDGWVIARDIFRQLHENEDLTLEQRQLVGILERYNQSRINWFHSREELQRQYNELQLQVGQLEEQKALLEQKITAITELEATISTRKEDTDNAGPPATR